MTKLTRISLGLAMAAIGGVMALGGGTPIEAANPSVTITPAQQNVAIGAGTVTFTVNVADVDNLAAYGFDLRFDHYVMEYQSTQNGDFLGSSGRQLSCAGLTFPHDGKDNVTVGCATFGDLYADGASGSGALATVTFKLVGGGTSALTFTSLDLQSPNADDVCGDPGDPGHAPCGAGNVQGSSITVDGPVLPRPTVDPNTTVTATAVPFASPTSAPAGGSTPAARTTPSVASTGTAGTPAIGTTPSGGALGSGTQPGSTGSGSSAGGAQGAGASGAGSTGVGRFGSGPDGYAQHQDNYRTRAIALAALGLMLIVAGVWKRRLAASQA